MVYNDISFYYRIDYEYCGHKTFVIFLNQSEVEHWLKTKKWNLKYKVINVGRYHAI